jgi:epsilon-lactone hydrolase
VDLTESGDSFALNQLVDVMLPRSLMPNNLLYAGGADLAHPYLSPLFGDFSPGFVPTFIQSGTRDLFLSNAVRLHRALHRAGVPCELHIFEAMPHGGFMGAPEDRELRAEVSRFVRACLPGAS